MSIAFGRFKFSVRLPATLAIAAAMFFSQTVSACDLCSCGCAPTDGHGHAHAPAPSMISGMSFSPTVQRSTRATTQLKFAVIGDTQGTEFGGRSGLLDALMSSVNTQNVDYVLFPGDLVGDTGSSGWNAWKTRTSVLGTNSMGVDKRLMNPGNHDRGSSGTFANWQNNFNWLPDSQTVGGESGVDQVDYYVDHGDVRFLSISTDAPGITYNNRQVGNAPPALDWMREVMKDVDDRNADADMTNDIKHVFTFSHRPVSTQVESPTGGTNGAWWQSMTGQDAASGNHAATAFLAGHWHMYQPSRPDPNVDTAEIISGTGGGGLEGQAHRNRHGYSIVTVDGGNVSSEFFGDNNGSSGGWSFQSLDNFTIAQTAGLPTGELAKYAFENGAISSDSSTSPLSKGHGLNYRSGATTFNDPTQGFVLNPNGGYVHAKDIGDNNLAVLRDLNISFDAKANSGRSGNDIIAVFGGASGSSNGSLNNQESANVAYELSLTSDGRLRLNWEHDNSTFEGALLSDVISDVTDWHSYQVKRDANAKTVSFFVDGVQLGNAVSFTNLPTGGGSGSLYIGGNIGGGNSFSGLLDNIVISSSLTATAVPEPSAMVVLGLGSLLAMSRRRRNRSH